MHYLSASQHYGAASGDRLWAAQSSFGAFPAVVLHHHTGGSLDVVGVLERPGPRSGRAGLEIHRAGPSALIFVDSNIPMYLVGAAHPHRTESQILVERLMAAGQRLVTDAEVLQEILHRFTAIHRRDGVGPALQALLDIVDDVFAVEKADVMRAAEIVQNRASFSARDAVHIAVMEHRGIQSILSFDADFDRWPGLKRIHAI